MKLSIIIPIYNGAPFLKKLIEGINAFTFSNFECIFIDNNSTDDSILVLGELLQNTSFAHIVLTESKQGAGNARNKGVKMARGEYLAFLDCDDHIAAEKFTYDFHILENEEVDFVFCRAKRFYDNGRILAHPINKIKEGINTPPLLGLLWAKNFFLLQGTGSLVVKKSVVEYLNGFHSSLTGEDAFLFIRMGLLFKGYFYNKTYFHYFRHRQSTISASNKDKNGALKRYFDLRQNLFCDSVVNANPLAIHILKEQLQVDLLKLQRLGHSLKSISQDERIKNLRLSYLLFNPISLFINRNVPHVKYNPFFQIDRRLFKKRRDAVVVNIESKDV